jgi:REP element-mobilizing transposase RayT
VDGRGSTTVQGLVFGDLMLSESPEDAQRMPGDLTDHVPVPDARAKGPRRLGDGTLPAGGNARPGSREARTYFLTYHTYGTWLHGDERHSVDRRHNIPETDTMPPDAGRLAAARERLKHQPTLLDAGRRQIVEATIREVCAHRGWHLHAVNVRTNHVHAVITARVAPEKVLTDLKAWATRRLIEAHAFPRGTRVWSRHGSTRYLWTEKDIEDACHYVVECQGIVLPKGER